MLKKVGIVRGRRMQIYARGYGVFTVISDESSNREKVGKVGECYIGGGAGRIKTDR